MQIKESLVIYAKDLPYYALAIQWKPKLMTSDLS